MRSTANTAKKKPREGRQTPRPPATRNNDLASRLAKWPNGQPAGPGPGPGAWARGLGPNIPPPILM